MRKLLLFLVMAALFASCGKKEETDTSNKSDEQQLLQSQQTQTQQQAGDQTKQDATLKEEKKKDNVKKEEQDKKYADKTDLKKNDTKKEKDESELKKVETKETSGIDFAPIFAKRCAKCHGKNLKGKKDGGPNLTADSVQNAPDSKLFNIISNGVKAKNEEDEDMPSFKKRFSEEEINAAIKFIKAHRETGQ